jgi:hypothetical protein
VAVGVLIAVVLVQLLLMTKLWCASGRMDERLARMEKAADERKTAELAEALDETQLQLDELSDDVDRLRVRYLSSAKSPTKASSGDAAGIEAGLTSMFPNIEALVDQKVSEKLKSKEGDVHPKFISMDELSEKLTLNQYQKQQVSDIFNRAKYEAFEVVSTPRSDGSSILEELKDAMLNSSQPRKDGTKVLLKLMVDDIPGTNETYFSRLTQIREDAISESSTAMNADQYESLKNLGVNVYAVQTGYNPLADYFRDVMATGN